MFETAPVVKNEQPEERRSATAHTIHVSKLMQLSALTNERDLLRELVKEAKLRPTVFR